MANLAGSMCCNPEPERCCIEASTIIAVHNTRVESGPPNLSMPRSILREIFVGYELSLILYAVLWVGNYEGLVTMGIAGTCFDGAMFKIVSVLSLSLHGFELAEIMGVLYARSDHISCQYRYITVLVLCWIMGLFEKMKYLVN
ncbi:unnamed protein product [Caenorhabditis nigoni]